MVCSCFFLGFYIKFEVWQMVVDWGYEVLFKKVESYEICFVFDNDYWGFFKCWVDGLEVCVDGGQFVNIVGDVIGIYKGYFFYIIGQCKGLGVVFGELMYVMEICFDMNIVVLGWQEEFVCNGMMVGKVNWMKYD